jgi:hypothetical protein
VSRCTDKSPEGDVHARNENLDVIPLVDNMKIISKQKGEEDSKPLINKKLLKKLRSKAERILESLDYHTIMRERGLGKKIYDKTDVDITSLKVIEISDKVEVILVLLVKISPLSDVIVVDKDSFQFNSTKANFDENDQIDEKYLKSLRKCLKKSQKTLHKELIEEGYFYRYLRNYLENSFYLEKTLGGRSLFFRNDTHQYKVIYNPVLVSSSSVKFFEQSIPFAFQGKSNLRFVSITRFQELIGYLENKYYVMENVDSSRSELEIRHKQFHEIWVKVSKISLPFFGFGVVLLIIFLLQVFFRVSLPLGVFLYTGYIAIGLLITLISFFYEKHLRLTGKIKKKFRTLHHRLPIELEESDLLALEGELNPEFAKQLAYECFGNEGIEEYGHLGEDFEEIDSEMIITSEKNDLPNLPNIKKSDLKKELIEKYGSFLDD